MSGKNAAKLCFWFKTAAAVLFLAALAGLCYYSISVLPERIKEGVEGSGAPVFAAVFGGGIAIAVVIALTILFCGIAAVFSVCAAVFAFVERRCSPLSGSSRKKTYLGFRIASDVLLALGFAFVLFQSLPLGANALFSTLTAFAGAAAVIAAEVRQGVALKRWVQMPQD